MIYLFRLLLGYVEFEFSGGFREDFINECFEKGIDIKNISLCDNGFRAICSIKTYKTLHRVAFSHAGRVKIIKKHGLPFLLHPLRNRFGFLVGAVCFVFIISFLGSFVWSVELKGNERVSDTVLYTYLENNRLTQGTMWGGIDRDKLSWQMMSDFEDFAWVHINKIGTTALVEVNETRQRPQEKDENKLKGNRVFRKELEAVAYREQSKMSVKRQKSYTSLTFFTLKIPLYFEIKKGDTEAVFSKYATIKDKALPIGYTVKTESFYQSEPKMLDDRELLELAKRKLSYSEQKEFDGCEIINKSFDYELDEEKCIAKGAYVVKE